MSSSTESLTVDLSPRKFLIGCLITAAGLLAFGRGWNIPAWVIGLEVIITILALFVLGSIKYRLDKNALTYGAVIVIAATFFWPWWNNSEAAARISAEPGALSEFIHHNFLTLHGLDNLIHIDTMLFILGLTFFVAVIAQTRLLESVSFAILRKFKGAVVPTVGLIAGIVSFSSGILDGVSMIGLMIRTLVIILFLAKAKDEAVLFAVIISTIVTTVCGMWLAYGEPPNLIMKSNLHPHLDNAFFLRYCLPVAIGCYFIVLWNVRKQLKGKKIDMKNIDMLDLITADVRFLQATRHGEVLTPIEFVENHADQMGGHLQPVIERLQHGEPLGKALILEKVPEATRRMLLGKFVAENLSEALDEHYEAAVEGKHAAGKYEDKINHALADARKKRVQSQLIGGLAFVPFIGLLIWHAIDHSVPLFYASFAGFVVAFLGIYGIPKMRKLALKEAKHEYTEYLFLFPLFFSITLLQKSGFFGIISELIHLGIERLGMAHVAYIQFTGATFLSAMLDNNVVADFAGRAIQGLEVTVIHLFAMAQIAGYAAGGCWTHVGSAQSVVAYSFILKEINPRFTPMQWIKFMTPVIIQIFILMTLVVYGEGWLIQHNFLH